MKKPAELIILSMLGVGALLAQGCATHSGSTSGDEYAEELVDEPMIKHIPPPEFGGKPTSRSRLSPRAELSAINATGLAPGALSDVLFDFGDLHRLGVRYSAAPQTGNCVLDARYYTGDLIASTFSANTGRIRFSSSARRASRAARRRCTSFARRSPRGTPP